MKAYNLKIGFLYILYKNKKEIVALYCGKSSICYDQYIFRCFLFDEETGIDARGFCINPFILSKQEVEKYVSRVANRVVYAAIQKNKTSDFCMKWVAQNRYSKDKKDYVELYKYLTSGYDKRYTWSDFCERASK